MNLRRVYQLKLLGWESTSLEGGENSQRQHIFESPQLVCACCAKTLASRNLLGGGDVLWRWALVKGSDLMRDVCIKGIVGPGPLPFFVYGLSISLACSHMGSCIVILILGWYNQGAATPRSYVPSPTPLFAYELCCLDLFIALMWNWQVKWTSWG